LSVKYLIILPTLS